MQSTNEHSHSQDLKIDQLFNKVNVLFDKVPLDKVFINLSIVFIKALNMISIIW